MAVMWNLIIKNNSGSDQTIDDLGLTIIDTTQIDFAAEFENRADMITNRNWFNLLAGNSILADQIIKGMTEDEIRKTWEKDLEIYKNMRKKYLLYIDFE